jgi:hypothetical protein
VTRVAPGREAWLLHYWAPWERHGRAQALALDSLVRTLPPDSIRIALVCFDPFPSVARFVARLRLRVPVLLDLRRDLQAALPCPSIPYTWLIDARGRVMASQPGEVDWTAPATRALLLEAARAAAGADGRPGNMTPRRPEPPGREVGDDAQTRAAASRAPGSARRSNAYPPNNAAL